MEPHRIQQHAWQALEWTGSIIAKYGGKLAGSRAFVRRHRAELNGLPTVALNIDSNYSVSELKFLVTDLNNHVRLDRALAVEFRAIARELGHEARLQKMIFGGGGTDAAELAKAGARATTMIVMPSGLVRDGLVYHTMRDTVDAVEPRAVEACLEVAYALALHVDQEKTHEPSPVSPEPVV